MITVQRVQMITGKGRVTVDSYERFTLSKKSIVIITNNDNLCLPRALVVALAHYKRSDSRAGLFHNEFRRLAHSRLNNKLQLEAARKLMTEAGVEIPPKNRGMGLRELAIFQKFFNPQGLAIEVYESKELGGRKLKPVYDGRSEVLKHGADLSGTMRLILNENHFDVILNMTGATAMKKFCYACRATYNREHRCEGTCPLCRASPACNNKMLGVKCLKCRRTFHGNDCLANHLKRNSYAKSKSICDAIKNFEYCGISIMTKKRLKHRCYERYCHTCRVNRPLRHWCYIAPLKKNIQLAKQKENTPVKENLFVFYDFETMQVREQMGNPDVKVHDVNLCVVQKVCEKCMYNNDMSYLCSYCGIRQFVFDHEPLKQFIDLVIDMKDFKQVICIAHNARGFDAQFVLKYIVETLKITPQIILNGTNILEISFEKVRFLDSLCYLSMPLSGFSKTFNLPSSLVKGYFPHLFNRPETQHYVGPLPDILFYSPDTMKIVNRAKFFTWYDELFKTEYVFDFAAEIKRYCISDVNLLRQGCLSFRKMFLEITEICPFAKAVTIASACSVVYRTNFLKQDSIGIIPKSGYRGFDNQSIIALEWFAWIEHERGYRIKHAGRGAEKVLPGGLKVDGYYESDSEKTVFEFYGCWFHGCPKCYPSDRDKANIVNDVWLTLNERYERTMLKSSRIRTLESGNMNTVIYEPRITSVKTLSNTRCHQF
ncbi:uncharacterized protein LOC112494759 [Cephus cinctus]|uniref:DNA-directed DNA polymerase n=1 Tax=Cephus cinctus TaxID=211228 RepID=A0AAJ7RMA0_CEPCN|nr:uncharacterized protein LOC112494759 [Cephus cinctus]